MAETLRVILARKDWKPSDLAYEAHLSYSVITNALNGIKISYKTAKKISDTLRVPLEDITDLYYSGKGEDSPR